MEQLYGCENMARLEPQNIGPLPRGQIAGLSGREILDQLLKGALPTPHFGPTLRMSLVEVDEGRVVFSGEPVDAFANPFGSVHGGVDRRHSRFRDGVRRPFDSEAGSDLYDDIDDHPICPRAFALSAPGSLRRPGGA